MEQFIGLLEARAREADVHLMTREDLIRFLCHTGVVEEGMPVEWWRLETPSLPEMKRVQGGKGPEEGPQEGQGAGRSGHSGPRQGLRLWRRWRQEETFSFPAPCSFP